MSDFTSHPSMMPPGMADPVLVVDDEPRYREMLVEAIGGMGFEAVGAGSAEQAMRLLPSRPFGIVLLDLNLPGMGGMELLEKVRRTLDGVEVIILTGFGDLQAAQQAIRQEVVDFLTKPCRLDELERSLSRARARRIERRSARLLGEPEGIPACSNSVASLEEVERNHILAVMKKHDGNRQAVADELGISVRTLYTRLGEYKRANRIP